MLVGLQRHHVEEERLINASTASCADSGQLTLSTSQRRLVAFQESQRSSRKMRDVPFIPSHQPKGALPMYTRTVELTSKSGCEAKPTTA